MIYYSDLKRTFKHLLIWGALLGLLILVSFIKGEAFIGQANSVAMIDSFPSFIKAMYLMGSIDLTTPLGYYRLISLYIMIGISFYIIGLIKKIVINEQKDKTIGYLICKPVSKNKIVTEKFLVICTNILTLNLILSAIGYYSLMPYLSNDTITVHDILIVNTDMLIYSYLMLAVILSLFHISGGIKYASSLVGLFYLVDASYIIFEQQKILYYLTPLAYLSNGFNDLVFSLCVLGIMIIIGFIGLKQYYNKLEI